MGKPVDETRKLIESSNVVQRAKKVGVKKTPRKKQFKPSKYQARMDSFVTIIKKGTKEEDKKEAVDRSLLPVACSSTSGGKGGFGGFGGLFSFIGEKKKEDIPVREESLSEFEAKLLENKNLLHDVAKECFEALLVHLQMEDEYDDEDPNCVTLKWIQKNCGLLKQGWVIPYLIVIISGKTHQPRRVNSARILRISDYTDKVRAVFPPEVIAEFGAIMTVGCGIVLTNVRVMEWGESIVIDVPVGGLTFLATKAKLSSSMTDKPILPLENNIVMVLTGNWTEELKKSEKALSDQVYSENELSQHLSQLEIEGEQKEDESDAESTQEQEASTKSIDNKSNEGTPRSQIMLIDDDHDRWGDDDFDDIMACIQTQAYMVKETGEDDLVMGELIASISSADEAGGSKKGTEIVGIEIAEQAESSQKESGKEAEKENLNEGTGEDNKEEDSGMKIKGRMARKVDEEDSVEQGVGLGKKTVDDPTLLPNLDKTDSDWDEEMDLLMGQMEMPVDAEEAAKEVINKDNVWEDDDDYDKIMAGLPDI